MVGKTVPARLQDRIRMDIIAKHCGCLPCLLTGLTDVHTTIEHVTDRGRRVGGDEQHQWTIGLCRWHHFGHIEGSKPRQKMSGDRGPSLAWGRITFEEFFGDELDVLVPTQDFMLELFDQAPWPEYAVPRHVARLVRHKWIDLNVAKDTSRYSGR